MSGIADYIAAVLAKSPVAFWDEQDAGSPLNDTGSASVDLTAAGSGQSYQDASGPEDALSIIMPGSGGAKFDGASPVTSVTDDFTLVKWFRVNNWTFDEGGAAGFGVLFEGSGMSWLISGDTAGFGQTARRVGGVWSSGFRGFGGTALSISTDYFVAIRREAGVWTMFLQGVPDQTPGTNGGDPGGNPSIGRAGKWNEFGTAVFDTPLTNPEILALYTAMIGGPPANITPPELSGVGIVGHTLTTSDGTWSDADSFAYQWEISADGMSGWTPIGGETTNAYVVDPGDVGMFLRCVVTATNGDGDTDEPSNVIGAVLDPLSGPIVVAFDDGTQVNSFSANDWTPDTSGVLAGDYMIAAIEAAFTAATGITAPDGWDLLETAAAVGGTLVNVYGKFTYEDTPTETFLFASAAQTACVFQSIRGGFNAEDPITTQITTTDNSLGNVSYDDQDLVLGITLGYSGVATSDILAIPVGFTDVRKERSPSLVIAGWCVDGTKLEATGAGNTSGLSFTYASGTDVYTLTLLLEYNPGDVPEVVTDPIATGEVAVFGTVTTTDGTWTFSPLSFTYQWQHSANGTTGWTNIPGATASSLLIENAYSMEFLRARVTAHNADGASVPAPSNVLGPVEPYPTVTAFTVVA